MRIFSSTGPEETTARFQELKAKCERVLKENPEFRQHGFFPYIREFGGDEYGYLIRDFDIINDLKRDNPVLTKRFEVDGDTITVAVPADHFE